MNYQLYKKARNKMLIKTGVFITIILLFAVICTYKIYNKFEGQRDQIRNSPSLEVTYHGKGEKVSITKITPMTDSVGLSSTPYKLTIKNNTNKKVTYRIVINPDKEKYTKHECGEYKIPNNIIKVGIHTKGEVGDVYNLDDLENNTLDMGIINPQEQIDYTIRFWVSKNTLIQDADMHFHGILDVVEE